MGRTWGQLAFELTKQHPGIDPDVLVGYINTAYEDVLDRRDCQQRRAGSIGYGDLVNRANEMQRRARRVVAERTSRREPLVSAASSDLRPLRRDLAVSGTTIERHAVAKLTFAVAGAALPLLVAVAWGLAGIPVPVGALAFVALLAGGGGFFVPDLLLTRRAAQRRRDFRYSLSLFLDLVVIVLAGGGGVETALHDAVAAPARLRRRTTTEPARVSPSGPRVRAAGTAR